MTKKKKKQSKQEEIVKKQAAQQAVPPTPPPAFISQAIEDARKVKREPQPEDDNILAEGADSDFWRLLKEYINKKLKGLKSQTTQAVVKSGYKLEEAGFRYILTDQLTHFGEDIISFVETKKEAILRMQKEEALKKRKAEKIKEMKRKRQGG